MTDHNAFRIGRRAVPIRLGNPSSRKSSGLVDSILPDDRQVNHWFEGSLQREALKIMMTEGNVSWICEDAPGFPWTDGLAWYDYRPPFVLGRPNGDLDIVEIQWAFRAEMYRLDEVIEKLRPFALEAGYSSLGLWTDAEIRNPPVRLANAELLHSVAKDSPDVGVIGRILAAVPAAGEGRPIRSLLSDPGIGAESFRAVAHLVWRGDLVMCQSGALIAFSANVRLASDTHRRTR